MPTLEHWGARLHVRCRVSPWASSSPCWGVTPGQPSLLELGTGVSWGLCSFLCAEDKAGRLQVSLASLSAGVWRPSWASVPGQ